MFSSHRFFSRSANPAEIAAQLGHSLKVLFGTCAHVIEELRGRERIDAEAEIRAAKKATARTDDDEMLTSAG